MSRLGLPAGGLTDSTILLRPWEEGDVAALVEELGDREVSRWVFTIPWPYTEQDARTFLGLADRQRESGSGAHLAVIAVQDDALAGGVSLAPVDWGNRSASVGYWTARGYRSRGIARAAAKLVVEWAIRDLGFERIELTCDPENLPSQRVAEAAGFRREGHLRGHLRTAAGRRDSLLYALLASDAATGPSAPSP